MDRGLAAPGIVPENPVPVGLGDPETSLRIDGDPPGLFETVEDPRARSPDGIEDLDRPVVRVCHPDPPVGPGDGEGVLEGRFRQGAVAVAEIEEARSDQGRDHTRLRIEEADGRGFGVGNKEPCPIGAKPRGLGQGGGDGGPIDDVLPSAPGAAVEKLPPRVVAPDLVATRHRDENLARDVREIPGGGERARAGRSRRASGPEAGLKAPRAGPGEGPHGSVLEIDRAQKVVPAIRDVERTSHPHETLGVAEGGPSRGPILRTGAAGPEPAHGPGPPIEDKKPVVAAVRDREDLLVDGDLARIGQGPRRRCGLRRVVRRCADERRALRDEGVEQAGDHRALALPGAHVHEDAPGIDERKRRPGPHTVATPEVHPGVEGEEMTDPEASCGLEPLARVRFLGELGAQDPDDGENLGVALFEVFEFAEHVKTVDAAERPEVEEHETSAERGQRTRLARPEPDEIQRELGGAHRSAGHGLSPRRSAGVQKSPAGMPAQGLGDSRRRDVRTVPRSRWSRPAISRIP